MKTDLSPRAAARKIGDELCRAAFWDPERHRCNWMGRADRREEVPGGLVPASAALEADLYRGSTGVALFLAELAALTGDDAARETAHGALRRSLHLLREHPLERASPLSFLSGHLGVAHVAQRCLELLPDDAAGLESELEQELTALRSTVAAAFGRPHALDYLGGTAGAIPALLRLARARGEASWLELAHRAGDELATAARRDGEQALWDEAVLAGPFSDRGPEDTSRPMPTGLSHGASGVALALLELHAERADQRLLELARGAFTYEDGHFDDDAGNWCEARSTADAPSFHNAWCHGAPGIALARLRARALDPGNRERWTEQARIALDTTASMLDARLDAPPADATLCHGTAGLSEVLLIGGRELDETSFVDAAGRAARALIERHGERGDWPSGIPSAGPTPALWLGSAGIGHHFLRLHAPERVPPILILDTGFAS